MEAKEAKETIADIVAEFREMVHKSVDGIIAVKADVIADRIEAAWKRDAKAIATENAVLPAVCITTKQSGNAAAMRDVLVDVYNTLEKLHPYALHINDISVRRAFRGSLCHAKNVIDTALSKPPRNCDLPLVVDIPADNNADKAWLVFRLHNPDAYFDVSGLLRCIDWLLAQSDERKGEGDGR